MNRALALLIVFIIALASTGCPDSREQAGEVVNVEVTGDTAPLSIEPDPVTTHRGDTVRWFHATADSLIIDLRGDTLGLPTADSLLSVAEGDTARTTIRSDAAYGRYKYTVTVVAGELRTSEDPHIIVEQ
ncbi:MAG: hypothetical protein PVJ64_07535 [Gemmatimonadales bacterium]|jgi:plastocyanin